VLLLWYAMQTNPPPMEWHQHQLDMDLSVMSSAKAPPGPGTVLAPLPVWVTIPTADNGDQLMSNYIPVSAMRHVPLPLHPALAGPDARAGEGYQSLAFSSLARTVMATLQSALLHDQYVEREVTKGWGWGRRWKRSTGWWPLRYEQLDGRRAALAACGASGVWSGQLSRDVDEVEEEDVSGRTPLSEVDPSVLRVLEYLESVLVAADAANGDDRQHSVLGYAGVEAATSSPSEPSPLDAIVVGYLAHSLFGPRREGLLARQVGRMPRLFEYVTHMLNRYVPRESCLPPVALGELVTPLSTSFATGAGSVSYPSPEELELARDRSMRQGLIILSLVTALGTIVLYTSRTS
jgi:hypothetical protein